MIFLSIILILIPIGYIIDLITQVLFIKRFFEDGLIISQKKIIKSNASLTAEELNKHFTTFAPGATLVFHQEDEETIYFRHKIGSLLFMRHCPISRGKISIADGEIRVIRYLNFSIILFGIMSIISIFFEPIGTLILIPLAAVYHYYPESKLFARLEKRLDA